MAKTLEKYTPEYVAEICGLDEYQRIQMLPASWRYLIRRPSIYSMGITQFIGVGGVKSIANLKCSCANW